MSNTLWNADAHVASSSSKTDKRSLSPAESDSDLELRVRGTMMIHPNPEFINT
jgi:hypothetical protein